MGANQPQNVSNLHSQMLETQQCLLIKRTDASLQKQSAVQNYVNQNLTDQEFDNLSKILKQNLTSSKKDQKKIENEIYELE